MRIRRMYPNSGHDDPNNHDHDLHQHYNDYKHYHTSCSGVSNMVHLASRDVGEEVR